MNENMQEQLKSSVSYDPKTGKLYWRKDVLHSPAGYLRASQGEQVKTSSVSGYECFYLNLKRYRVHVVAFLLMTGSAPERPIDHVNCRKDDNRWENLRLASHEENNWNRGKQANNTSGFKGVTAMNGKWRASIRANKRYVHLGLFDTPEAAHAAYSRAAKTLHGDFARAE